LRRRLTGAGYVLVIIVDSTEPLLFLGSSG